MLVVVMLEMKMCPSDQRARGRSPHSPMGVDSVVGDMIMGFLDPVLSVGLEVGILENRGAIEDILVDVEDADHLGHV